MNIKATVRNGHYFLQIGSEEIRVSRCSVQHIGEEEVEIQVTIRGKASMTEIAVDLEVEE